jgi:FkbM family methyltransferase
MGLKELSLHILPPIAVDGMRWLLNLTRKDRVVVGQRLRVPYGDFFLECDSTHHLPQILVSLPNFGRRLADVVLALKVDQPCVIDVGANIGDTALLLARFAPGAKVLCVEGDSSFIADLKRNTSQIAGVTIAQAFLSDRTAVIRGKLVTKDGTGHVVLDENGDALQVQTLDDLLASSPQFSSPHVIKIDTDGYDAAILRGAQKVLATVKPVVFYEWHPGYYNMAGESVSGHAEFLSRLGYEGFLIFTNRGELLLSMRNPGPEIWNSLAYFSSQRRTFDDLHYDVAAFPRQWSSAWKDLSKCQLETGIQSFAGLLGQLTAAAGTAIEIIR